MAMNRMHARTQYDLISEAEVMHLSLFSNSIDPSMVITTLSKLDRLYMQILANDRLKLKREFYEAVSATRAFPALATFKKMIDRQALIDIINKLLGYDAVLEKDIAEVKNVNLPEMFHILNYFQFLKGCESFVKVLKQLLRECNQSLLVIANNSTSLSKLRELLVGYSDDMELEHVVALYSNVSSLFMSTKSDDWRGAVGFYKQYHSIFSSQKFISPIFTEILKRNHKSLTADAVLAAHDHDLRSSVKRIN